MDQTTCATLATLVPVLLLVVALEGRGIHRSIRHRNWYRYMNSLAIVAGFVATTLAVYGTSIEGFTDQENLIVTLWATTIMTGICSFVFLLLLSLSSELADESESD